MHPTIQQIANGIDPSPIRITTEALEMLLWCKAPPSIIESLGDNVITLTDIQEALTANKIRDTRLPDGSTLGRMYALKGFDLSKDEKFAELANAEINDICMCGHKDTDHALDDPTPPEQRSRMAKPASHTGKCQAAGCNCQEVRYNDQFMKIVADLARKYQQYAAPFAKLEDIRQEIIAAAKGLRDKLGLTQTQSADATLSGAMGGDELKPVVLFLIDKFNKLLNLESAKDSFGWKRKLEEILASLVMQGAGHYILELEKTLQKRMPQLAGSQRSEAERSQMTIYCQDILQAINKFKQERSGLIDLYRNPT